MHFRRSSVSMIFGIAGSHKTRVVLNALANMQVPTLVFSTDSDMDTVSSRLLALSQRAPTATTEDWLRQDPVKASRLLERFDFLSWDFSPNPTLDEVWLSVYAYAEREGRWPEQIVVDIASDIGHDTGDEWGSLRDLLRQAKVMARETGAHVLLVHHASESQNTKKPCPRRSDMHGKVAAIPVLIVSVGMDDRGDLWAACVKNRFGHAKADASECFRMALDASQSYVGDWISQPQGMSWGRGEEGW